MVMSQIFKFVDSPKTQKSKYLENETIFCSNKIPFTIHYRLQYSRNSFFVEVTLKPSTCIECVNKYLGTNSILIDQIISEK